MHGYFSLFEFAGAFAQQQKQKALASSANFRKIIGYSITSFLRNTKTHLNAIRSI